jgi:DNA mismatch repair protein MutH
MALPYDKYNRHSIARFAKRLENNSLRSLFGDVVEQRFGGKGRLGQLVEEFYFRYTPNSKAGPDFAEASLELKTAGLLVTKKGYRAKERLVLNNINYFEEHKRTFLTSTFWAKNQFLLILFYLYEAGRIDVDIVFKIVAEWEFPPTDLKIIEDDWNKIRNKILDGRAHEISEGDTLYLGACMHGATKAKAQTKQPFSRESATRRAFSLKQRYVNFIIEEGLRKQSEAIVRDVQQYRPGETFEEYVVRQFEPYKGQTEREILRSLGLPISRAKSHLHLVARGIVRTILGISKPRIAEFEKAGIEMKTISLEPSGRVKESMSFAQIKFKEIIDETWEESYWYETVTKRFFFVVFRKDKNRVQRFEKVFFWTMPSKEVAVARQFWEHTKQQILNDDYKNFWTLKDRRQFHVRPKGTKRDGSDLMETPSGGFEEKVCYWINAAFIRDVIGSHWVDQA